MKALKIAVEVDFIKLEESQESIINCYKFMYEQAEIPEHYVKDILFNKEMQVKTSRGWMTAKFGDYIIKDSQGCYVRTEESFKRNYKVIDGNKTSDSNS